MSELQNLKDGLRDGYQHSDGITVGIPSELAHALLAHLEQPIDMVLYCPSCGEQHIDEPAPCTSSMCETGCACPQDCIAWTNPPHRSHLCRRCGCVWRPADVPTNGVKDIKTEGKNDTWSACPEQINAQPARKT